MYKCLNKSNILFLISSFFDFTWIYAEIAICFINLIIKINNLKNAYDTLTYLFQRKRKFFFLIQIEKQQNIKECMA